MGLAVFKERRLTERRRLTGLLPGRLVVKDTGADLICRPVDVSATGMGIVTAFELAPGAELSLKIRDGQIKMHVAWGQPDFGKHDMFRYGLVTVDATVDIEQAFIRAGCLK